MTSPPEMDNVTSSDNVTSRDPEVFTATLVEQAIVRYAFPTVVFIGTLGNMTSLAVLLRPRMRGKSVYLFLLLLAIADTVVLYISAFKTWIRVISGFELLNVSMWSCRIVLFVTLVSQHMAAWIVVLVTIDRFVAVWFPLQATSWCRVTRASVATAICAALVAIYNGHVFWTFELSERSGRCRPTSIDGKVISFMVGPFNHLRFVTYCLLPFVVILILNILIVARLRWTPHTLKPGLTGGNPAVSIGLEASSVGMSTPEHRCVTSFSTRATRFAASTSTSPSASASAVALRQKQQSRVTYMLLVVSIAWLLLTTPYAVFTLCVQTFSKDPQTAAIQRLIRGLCFLLMYINHAVNFLLYCLTGRKFRVELKEMMASLCPRPAKRWVVSSLSSMRTTRSNCVELEALNDGTVRANGTVRDGTVRGTTYRSTAASRRQFFVGEPANEVDVVVRDDEVIDGHVTEEAV